MPPFTVPRDRRAHTVFDELLAEDAQRSADDLLTTRQFSEQYAIAVATLRNWRWKRQGPPFIRQGRKKIVYRRRDIDSWLARVETRQP